MKSARMMTCSIAVVCLAAVANGADKLEYNKSVRPILADACFACHGPDSAARKADLRLDQRDAAMTADAIVPGKPDESEMIRRILSDDPAEVMPPPKTNKKLTPAQKELLRRWVQEGAEYQQHWSLIAPVRPALPAVRSQGWVKNPIDRFILTKLEAQGLAPAPEADRRTLARRLSLDLTGLPPDPAEVEAFVNDMSPDAYEKLVDRFLMSEHWGEHRGRYWLDAARYADTHGIHFDNFREIWAYRDWVIKAFNQNMPFDRFTVEQLAGDLLPNRTLDQVIASGFNRCNITTNEGGTIPEEYLVLYTRDRTETTSQVWMGLTANCAVCHDHKFDPLTMKDFYSMAAFFNNTTQNAMDGNIKDTPPNLVVPKPEDRDKWDRVSREIADVRAGINARKQMAKPDFETWLADARPEQVSSLVPTEKLRLHAPLNEGDGKSVTLTVDGAPREVSLESGFGWAEGKDNRKVFSLKDGDTIEVPEAGDFEADAGFSCSAWVRLPRRNLTGSIVSRMDNGSFHRGWDLWVEGDKIGMHIVNAWPTDALKVVGKTQLDPKQWYHVTVTYDGSKKANGVRVFLNGVPESVSIAADALKSTIRATVPLKIGQRSSGERLPALLLENLRVYERTLTPAEVANLAKADRLLEVLSKPAAERSEPERNELFDWWLASFDEPSKQLTARLGALQQEEVALKSAGTIALVMQEKPESPMAYILYRGEYDKRRDQVTPATPAVLPPMPPDLPKNRLGFAQWLLRPDHPLTARVTVNRFWQEVFGTGLVRTTGDFGISGELPSHPELLDWLAVEFRESGWDMKQFFRLLVTSATYRQLAATTPDKLEKDPQNRLLSRGPRFRMDAEMVRDYALAASGLLVRKIGGPSVKPYQPPGVWEAVAMIGSNTRDYKPDTGENLYRRGMYTFWKRSAPPALFDIFNAPSREVCTVRRERTNTPLQALATLNDPTFVEAARQLAQTMLKNAGETMESRCNFLALRLLSRPFRANELALVQQSLADLLAYYQAHEDDARNLITVGESKADATMDVASLAAWTMLTNELMNLDEVLNK